MAYTKTDWKARQGKNLNKFTKSQETSSTVILENTPDEITEPGTSFNIERMNKIEQGIYDAHELVAVETQDRQKAINSLVEKTINIIGRPEGIASLDEQAKIPLEQLPDVFSEDFSDLINAISTLESNILEKIYPVGSGYIQGINDPDPIEKGLPGHWELWTHRAEQYRLTSTALPAYTTYTSGANYAKDAYVLWHLNGAGYELFKAKAAITGAAAQLDPVLWTKYTTGTIVDRRILQSWLDDDFAIGKKISGGEYNNYYVSEVITLGGTFPSWEGGNRPTFNSGVAGDVERRLKGTAKYAVGITIGYDAATGNAITTNEGVLQLATLAGYYKLPPTDYQGVYAVYGPLYFDNAFNITTGNEFSPCSLSYCKWRRTV